MFKLCGKVITCNIQLSGVWWNIIFAVLCCSLLFLQLSFCRLFYLLLYQWLCNLLLFLSNALTLKVIVIISDGNPQALHVYTCNYRHLFGMFLCCTFFLPNPKTGKHCLPTIWQVRELETHCVYRCVSQGKKHYSPHTIVSLLNSEGVCILKSCWWNSTD